MTYNIMYFSPLYMERMQLIDPIILREAGEILIHNGMLKYMLPLSYTCFSRKEREPLEMILIHDCYIKM